MSSLLHFIESFCIKWLDLPHFKETVTKTEPKKSNRTNSSAIRTTATVLSNWGMFLFSFRRAAANHVAVLCIWGCNWTLKTRRDEMTERMRFMSCEEQTIYKADLIFEYNIWRVCSEIKINCMLEHALMSLMSTIFKRQTPTQRMRTFTKCEFSAEMRTRMRATTDALRVKLRLEINDGCMLNVHVQLDFRERKSTSCEKKFAKCHEFFATPRKTDIWSLITCYFLTSLPPAECADIFFYFYYNFPCWESRLFMLINKDFER